MKISPKMRPPRSRRVQAQRKFAHGAYVPQNNVPVVASQENRRDGGTQHVTINKMSPRDMLDLISMQGTHTHLQPVVLVERWRGRSPTGDIPHTAQTGTAIEKENVINNAARSKLQHRKKKVYKQMHVMSLRPRQLKKHLKKSDVIAKKITKRVIKRKGEHIEPEKKNPKTRQQNKHTGVKDRRVHSSEFSLDDNRPLTYFAKCSTPKKRTAMMVQLALASTEAEAVAGPSGCNTSSVSGSYYNSEHNIHRWMNDSITPETPRAHKIDIVEPAPINLKTSISQASIPVASPPLPSTSRPSIPVASPPLPSTPVASPPLPSTSRPKIPGASSLLPSTSRPKIPVASPPLPSIPVSRKSSLRTSEPSTLDLSTPVYKERINTPCGRFVSETGTVVSQIKGSLKQALAGKDELARLVAQKQAEISRIEADRQAEIIRRAHLRAELEAEVHMIAEVDRQAKALENEKDAKRLDVRHSSETDAAAPGARDVVEAPVFRPSVEEFTDPIVYFDKIWAKASKFGICKVVPPEGWKPTFKVQDDIRFNVTNQYISRLFNRWGPAARELCAIKLCLQLQKINFTRPPLLDGVEVNLPKLYHHVQRHGGLETVINMKRWGKVANEMKINRTPTTERKLDQIYVKYLLPYDTLAHHERQEIMRKVENAWHKKNQKLLDRAMNPLHRQKRMLGLSDSSDDETEDEDTSIALNEAEDCIIGGPLMNRAKFKRVATNAYENVFGQGSEAREPASLPNIEDAYWRNVLLGTEHLCVHTAAIDTGEEGHGFTKNKNDPYGSHPWNLKMFSQHPRNVLRSLGPVLGVTVPTLHLSMLFSTSCWHKDPHVLPWLEYQNVGPSRIWYGIPNEQSDNFRKAVETLSPTSCQNKSLWLSSEISMIPPHILRQHNVSLSRTTQEKNEFILAFPKAYTCCISTGYTESESVYFAPPSWLDDLPGIFFEARESCEPTMFSMEQLLLLMGKDTRTDKLLLQKVQLIYDKMLRDEVNNRQMLQERGLKFIHEAVTSPRRKRQTSTWNVRDHDECEYCRSILFLSKVQGVTSKNSSLCLEHALKLLDTDRYRNKNVERLEVFVYVSVRELNSVADDMARRLASPA